MGLAEQVAAGRQLRQPEGLAILQTPDDELLELLAAAYWLRRRRHGNRVHLNVLLNAKSGLCREDCGYCSQSSVSRADIPRYRILKAEEIISAARRAAQQGARTYCIVVSGRSPTDRELQTVAEAVRQIKAELPLRICVSPGFLDLAQAQLLARSGVDRVNHNLNTSQRYYPHICTTHSYQQRLDTLAAVRQAGMEICCGGIVGMGESPEDVVEMALRIGQLRAEAVPVNFYQPIPGTPLARPTTLTPQYCLKVLCLFRMTNPNCELRIAAGREMHLRSLQPLGLFVADSIFVGDYLTTKGQPAEDDFRMIADLGFEPVVES
jgi:biotin synthase